MLEDVNLQNVEHRKILADFLTMLSAIGVPMVITDTLLSIIPETVLSEESLNLVHRALFVLIYIPTKMGNV